MFSLGFRIGLLPEQALDMSLDQFNACVDGYSNRLLDQQKLAAQQGYWAGYYSRATHPKPLQSVINKMDQSQGKPQKHVAEVDVEEFLRREAQFKKNGGGSVAN